MHGTLKAVRHSEVDHVLRALLEEATSALCASLDLLLSRLSDFFDVEVLLAVQIEPLNLIHQLFDLLLGLRDNLIAHLRVHVDRNTSNNLLIFCELLPWFKRSITSEKILCLSLPIREATPHLKLVM